MRIKEINICRERNGNTPQPYENGRILVEERSASRTANGAYTAFTLARKEISQNTDRQTGMAMVLIIDGSSEYVAHVEKKYLSVFLQRRRLLF